jgi:nucleoside-diphosphate-sugar epimerase
MRVFLTGGTGLLGSHLAEGLLRSGHEVLVLVRPGSDGRHLTSVGCELVEGDVQEAREVHARRLEGCHAVVHGAATIYGAPSLELARAVNVEGTRRVLEGAALSGVPIAVHISSVAVYGNPPGPMSEETPLDHPLPVWDFYGRSKREGEGVARSLHGRDGMQVTVLRPPAVFGERDRLFLPRIVRWLRRPVLLLPGSGRTLLPLVYAGNLVGAVERVLEGHGGGEVFNVTRDFDITLRMVCQGLSRELGLGPRLMEVPAAPLRWLAKVGEPLGLRIPGARDLPLARAARLALEDNPFASDKARSVLGWRPAIAVEEALARSGRWLRDHGTATGGKRHGRQ